MPFHHKGIDPAHPAARSFVRHRRRKTRSALRFEAMQIVRTYLILTREKLASTLIQHTDALNRSLSENDPAASWAAAHLQYVSHCVGFLDHMIQAVGRDSWIHTGIVDAWTRAATLAQSEFFTPQRMRKEG